MSLWFVICSVEHLRLSKSISHHRNGFVGNSPSEYVMGGGIFGLQFHARLCHHGVYDNE